MHVIAAKAVAFKEALSPEFKKYQQQIIKNAKVLADTLKQSGLELVSGGTDNHLILIDLTNKNVTGKDAEAALGRANITVNKNTVPFETKSPFVTSGIRIGTPALTTRGMKEKEMEIIGQWICDIIDNIENEKYISEIGAKVKELASGFPLFME
jgi:glycine hydroxymethyltransferase